MRDTLRIKSRSSVMNIKEKVLELLKYCSSYQGHSYMVDERRTNGGFQVTSPEEEEMYGISYRQRER